MTLMIEGIEVECIIGDLPEEREREQTLVVDAELEIPDRAAETDALADTVDYAAAAERVRAALKAAECRMIERAAKVVRSDVKFRALSDAAIEEYVRRVRPLDRAGAYDIDESGDLIVESYTGSYENIMGLPLGPLREWGIVE